jgi:triacylglycerol lipase
MSIKDLNPTQRAILFAKLSQYAYKDAKIAKKETKDLGFTKTTLISHLNAQCMVYENTKEIVLAFRGTEPKQFRDIKADLKAWKTQSRTKGKVHDGFYDEVEKIWDQCVSIVNKGTNAKKELWICGHSLGAAMACIAASRLYESRNVEHVYTYGCPRIGNKHWVEQNHFKHSRFVNNNDIVPKVPLAIMGFKHHGKLEYINYYGNFRTATIWQRSKDQWRGRWRALQKFQLFDGIMDHLVTNYVKKLNKSK